MTDNRLQRVKLAGEIKSLWDAKEDCLRTARERLARVAERSCKLKEVIGEVTSQLNDALEFECHALLAEQRHAAIGEEQYEREEEA